jgi:hypothetical protein
MVEIAKVSVIKASGSYLSVQFTKPATVTEIEIFDEKDSDFAF